MALSARITLTSAGNDTGPFNLYSNIDGYTNAFESSILRSNLVNGFTTNNIPNSTSIIRLISMGVCTNYIDLNLITITPTPTPTSTTNPNTFNVTNDGSSNYLINGQPDPTLSLTEGQTYTFNINASGHPFWIKTISSIGTENAYNSGVTNNGTAIGTITFVVPYNVPSTLYYNCQVHSSMAGTINIIDVLTPTPTPTLTITPTPTSTPTGPTPTPTPTSTGPTPTPTPTSTGPTPTPTPTSTGPTPTPTPTSNITLYNVASPIYTSYDEFNGNTSTLKYYANLTDLYNSIMVESNRVSNIMETVKTDNAGGFVNGAKIYNSNNTLFNITGYMCFIDNGAFKYINIVNSLITETGSLSAPSANTVTGSKILFPYYTKGGDDNSTGWGSIGGFSEWKHRLNINGLTLSYLFRNGNYDSQINSGGTFVFGDNVEVRDGQAYYGTHANWICRPYYTINRRTKTYGLPNNYTIPNIYRGTLIELIISVEVTPPNNIPGYVPAQAILNAKNIVRYEFNMAYSILVGK